MARIFKKSPMTRLGKLRPYPKVYWRYRDDRIFGEHYETILQALDERQYSISSQSQKITVLFNFAAYLCRRGVTSLKKVRNNHADLFWTSCIENGGSPSKSSVFSSIHFALKILTDVGQYSAPIQRIKEPKLLAQYASYLQNERGLSESVISFRSVLAGRLLAAWEEVAPNKELKEIDITFIQNFILSRGHNLSRSSLSHVSTNAKCFLKFLKLFKHHPKDLSQQVEMPIVHNYEQVPGALPWCDVETALGTFDRCTPLGKRDFAIFLLLVTYGIRSRNAINLKLDDIDWKNDAITFSKTKSRRSLKLPLVPQIGNAIIDYLKHGRPESSSRDLFLNTRAPYTKLKTSSSVYHLVRTHLTPTDGRQRGFGGHSLRHTRATNLIVSGVKIKTTGDILDHGCPNSTKNYMRLDLEKLREVCLEVGV